VVFNIGCLRSNPTISTHSKTLWQFGTNIRYSISCTIAVATPYHERLVTSECLLLTCTTLISVLTYISVDNSATYKQVQRHALQLVAGSVQVPFASSQTNSVITQCVFNACTGVSRRNAGQGSARRGRSFSPAAPLVLMRTRHGFLQQAHGLWSLRTRFAILTF
jgi:hypothetical protein